LIEIQDLTAGFGEQIVLDSISCNIPKHITTLIVGESGTGKSVLAKAIMGLLEPQKGDILLENQNIFKISKKDFWELRKKMAMLFQNSALLDSYNVFQNIALPLMEHRKISQNKMEEIVNQKLQLVGLEGILQKMPSELSGGMRKRAALARAIILDPEYIIYDEPTTGLDPRTSNEIIRLMIDLQANLNITSIIITHDLNCIEKTAENVIMLNKGKIHFDGIWQRFKVSPDKEIQKFLRNE
jgi:phospholipid/cholesterol/gamma-HCH transport system ATP-binding protein